MKKTFRRRAPRKGTLRKRTHGVRKLRKMRGGWEPDGKWGIKFTETETKRIMDYKDEYNNQRITLQAIYARIFLDNRGEDMRNKFTTAIQNLLLGVDGERVGNGQGRR